MSNTLRRLSQLAIVGFILVVAWWLQGAVWDMVTVFFLASMGQTFALALSLILWFGGLVLLAIVTIWVVKRFA